MKCIIHLLLVLFVVASLTGCETTHTERAASGSSCCADARPMREPLTAAQAVGNDLFWLGQSALYSAASDTAQKQAPYPH